MCIKMWIRCIWGYKASLSRYLLDLTLVESCIYLIMRIFIFKIQGFNPCGLLWIAALSMAFADLQF